MKWYPSGFSNIIPYKVLEQALQNEITGVETGRPNADPVKLERPC
jgi:hypothetical protein